MVVHFVKQNKRVLVVGSKPMILQRRSSRGVQTALGALMDYLTDHDNCGVFFLKQRYLGLHFLDFHRKLAVLELTK